MSFNSFEFLVFFVVVTGLYFVLPHRLRWLQLLVASSVFYMFFIPSYVLILFFTIIVDYVAGILIEAATGRRRSLYLAFSLAANIGILAVFKYYNFAIDNLNMARQALHMGGALRTLDMLLPIGLSFHTFQAMSYTIEVYRGHQKAERHFGIYALYVMFYPQLVAGPIERPQNMLHQFHEPKTFDEARAVSGLRLLTWGLFKKVVVADRLGVMVNEVYGHPTSYHGFALLVAMVCFSFQVYCDFSGYSDIALGSARVMGFTLMRNFDTPFLSLSVTEFWRRWHISLSTWFNDYLFLPLCMATRDWGRAGLALSLFVTFLLSGLWHGAGWTFVVYGGLHGAVLIYEALTRRTRRAWASRVGKPAYDRLAWTAMFGFVTLSFVFFRAPNLRSALHFIRHGLAVFEPGYFQVATWDAGGYLLLGQPAWKAVASFLPLALMWHVEASDKKRPVVQRLEVWPTPARWGVYYALAICILLFGYFGSKQFIYFQF